MYQSFPLNKICRYAEFFLCVGLAAVRLTHRFKAATPRRTTQLNEEKLCQVLANQTRALQKKRSQGASHAHHLPIKPLQSQASLRVPETVAQVQTSSHVKMVAVVVQNSALQTPMPHALHAQRVHSLKLVLQKLMETAMSVLRTVATMLVVQNVQPTETAMTALRKAVTTGFQVMSVATLKTVVVTRVVQSVRLTATAMTVVLVAETAQLTAVQVQLPVAATVAK
jgi:hypothetical protein